MKSTTLFLLTLLLTGVLAMGAYAQDSPAQNGECHFIDEDGDGFNDLAPDADGDGIPNGMDPDYVHEDGEGAGNMWGRYARIMMQLFGEGIQAQGPGQEGNSFGPGESSGEVFGPGEHSGFGQGIDGTDGEDDEVIPDNRQDRRSGRF